MVVSNQKRPEAEHPRFFFDGGHEACPQPTPPQSRADGHRTKQPFPTPLEGFQTCYGIQGRYVTFRWNDDEGVEVCGGEVFIDKCDVGQQAAHRRKVIFFRCSGFIAGPLRPPKPQTLLPAAGGAFPTRNALLVNAEKS